MLNNCTFMGRLTKEIELRYTTGAEPVPVTNFRIAVPRDFKNKDNVRDTDFISIEAWRQKAIFVEKNFCKGQLMIVEGRLQIDKWKDDNNNLKSDFKIVANNIYFAGQSKKENEPEQAEQAHTNVLNTGENFAFDPYAVETPIEQGGNEFNFVIGDEDFFKV